MASLSVESPIGHLVVEEEDEVIVRLGWSSARPVRPAAPPTHLLAEAHRQIEAYFFRRLNDFDLPLRPAGSRFQQAVWQRMQKIPYGATASYGEMARDLKTAARAVGGACGSNPIPLIVPCHRVLGGGGIGGYSGRGGLDTKRYLLALEGAALL